MIQTAIVVNQADEDIVLRGYLPLHSPVPLDLKTREEWLENRKTTIGGTDAPALFEGMLENESFGDDAAASVLYSNLNLREALELSPYQTLWGLWMEKKDLIPANHKKENTRMHWGTRLENVIAYGIAEEHGLTIRKANRYLLHPYVERMGASLDFEAEITIDSQTFHVPFEIKNVSGEETRKWTTVEQQRTVPPHIAIQVQHQLAVTGAPFALIGVLFGGNNAELILMHRKGEIIQVIETAVSDFWNKFDAGEAPLPDYERDAELIKKIYAQSVQGSFLDWSKDKEAKELVAQYQTLESERKKINSILNSLGKNLDEIKSRLLVKLGDAEGGDMGNIVFVAKTVAEQQRAPMTIAAHRRFSIKKKTKK